MAVVGVAFSNGVARFALATVRDDVIEATAFGSFEAASWDDALKGVRRSTNADEVAVVVEPPAMVIHEAALKVVRNDAERRRAVRMRAEEFDFNARRDDVRVRFDEDNRAFFAALKREVADDIRRAAVGSKMRLVWMEHAAYAWIRLLDEEFSALIDASDDHHVVCVVAGDRRAELRVFDADKHLSTNIDDVLRRAERTGFTHKTLSEVALIDPHGLFSEQKTIGGSLLRPYWLPIAPTRTAWMLPLGAAFAACGGDAGRDLLRLNFAEPEPRRWQDTVEPIVSRLPQMDAAILGAGLGIAALGIGIQAVQLHMLTQRTQYYSQQVAALTPEAQAVTSEATIVSNEAKFLADREDAALSGPRAARGLAAWMARYPNGATLTNVSYSPEKGLSVRGNARNPRDIEIAFGAINHAGAKVHQAGSTFTIEDSGTSESTAATSTSTSASTPAPASGAITVTPAPVATGAVTGARSSAPPQPTASPAFTQPTGAVRQ